MGRIGRQGFTLVEIMIVVAILGIIIAVATPGFLRAREQARARACQENLFKIAGAVEMYAMEQGVSMDDSVPMSDLVRDDGAGYFNRPPRCPSGGQYLENIPLALGPECNIGANADNPQWSHTLEAAMGTPPPPPTP